VVVVGDGSAEERHYAIAHNLVDGALVAMDGLHHPLKHGVQDLARLLGITIREQLHRALEVGEEHGDLLAFALEGALGGENLLGKVFWGVRRRRGELHRRRGRRHHAYGLAAFLAELRVEPICRATARASLLQTRPAFLAKHCIGGVLVLTPGTLHPGPPDKRAAEG